MKPGAIPAVAPGADFRKPISFIERSREDIENYLEMTQQSRRSDADHDGPQHRQTDFRRDATPEFRRRWGGFVSRLRGEMLGR